MYGALAHLIPHVNHQILKDCMVFTLLSLSTDNHRDNSVEAGCRCHFLNTINAELNAKSIPKAHRNGGGCTTKEMMYSVMCCVGENVRCVPRPLLCCKSERKGCAAV